MNGVERIAAERKRQIEEKGWSAAHDQQHMYGELSENAIGLIATAIDADPYSQPKHPSDDDDTNRYYEWGLARKHKGDELRCLEIAGALIAAEIDRLQQI